LNVLFVTPTLPPYGGWGGIGTYVLRIARALVTAGHNVTVLCNEGDGPAKQDGFSVVRLLPMYEVAAVRSYIRSQLPLLISDYSIDLVEFPEYQALGVEFQREHLRFPVVVRIHGGTHLTYYGNLSPFESALRKVFPPKKVVTESILEYESITRAIAISAPSHWALEQAAKRCGPIRQIAEVYWNPESESSVSQSTGLKASPKNPTLVFFGRLDRLKGANLYPQIINLVSEKRPDVRFDVVGQDEHYKSILLRRNKAWAEYIKKRLSVTGLRNTTFKGGINHLALDQHLLKGDIAVFLSTWETQGYTHSEAMARGLSCVIASGGGARELGRDGRDLIFAERNSKDIAAKCVTLIDNILLREYVSANASTRVMSTMAPSVVAAQATKLYEMVLSGKH
jgi:glycosyltransferase involved in cell wall biosynthesis